jgi:hypothetical protein
MDSVTMTEKVSICLFHSATLSMWTLDVYSWLPVKALSQCDKVLILSCLMDCLRSFVERSVQW